MHWMWWAGKTNVPFVVSVCVCVCDRAVFIPNELTHFPQVRAQRHWQIEWEVYFSLLIFFPAVAFLLFCLLTWLVLIECVFLSECLVHRPIRFFLLVTSLVCIFGTCKACCDSVWPVDTVDNYIWWDYG